MAARMTIPVGLSATFTVTKKGNGAPLIVAANRRLINTQWEERPFGRIEAALYSWRALGPARTVRGRSGDTVNS